MDGGPRVAIVTGGSSGIGLAVGRMLVERGYDVVLTARTADKLEAAADGDRRALGGRRQRRPRGVRRGGGRGGPRRPARARGRGHGGHVRAQGVARDVRVGAAHQPHLGVRRRPRRAAGDGGRRADRVPVVELGPRAAAGQDAPTRRRRPGSTRSPARWPRRWSGTASPSTSSPPARSPRRCSTTCTSRCARSASDDVAQAVVWLDTLPGNVVLPELRLSSVDEGPFAPEAFVPEAARQLGRTELPERG